MPVQDAILIDLLVGALVACLGWALGGGLARRDATAAVGLTGLFVGVIGLCHSVLVPTLARGWLRIDLHRIGMRTFGDEKQAAAYADAFTPLFDSPAFRRRLASRGEELVTREVWHWKKPYEMLADHLIAEGRARLSPDDANAMFDVRRALADVSWPVCTAQFTDRGDVGLETLGDGLRGLKESDQRSWIALSARALALELDAIGPPPRISRAAVDAAMADVMKALPREQQIAVEPLYETFSLPPDKACEAFHALAAGMNALTPVARATLMRSLDHPELVE